MPFEYIDLDEAIGKDGLRMVVVGDVPSPWGEAAKGIFHIKGIEWSAVRLIYDDPRLKQWAGQRSGPVAVYNDEPPLGDWQDILLLAERLEPSPPLLSDDSAERIEMLDLAGDICRQGGLGWSRRLQLVHLGLNDDGGFSEPVSKYLAAKYGYSPEAGETAEDEAASVLQKLARHLRDQQRNGDRFYFGSQVSALDVYSATAMALFDPLPPELCKMNEASRRAFASRTPKIQTALDPALLAHRDMMYREFFELPLSL